MFRAAAGFKAQCRDLTVLVASDFDEWRILLRGPNVIVQGGRQFTEQKAKEAARLMTESFLKEHNGESGAAPGDFEWKPLDPGEWQNWRP